MKKNREFLKAHLWGEWEDLQLDQREGVPNPPYQKPYSAEAERIDLIPVDELSSGQMALADAIANRKSRRVYNGQPISLEELSFLLWSTQGIRATVQGGKTTLRTVPSGGARHPLETYLFINNVEGVETGLYRYLAREHQLLPLKFGDNVIGEVHAGTRDQFVPNSAVVFIWSAIPYRAEWRYGPVSHKMIAIDAGHVCQNLYLACEAIGAGTCAIGAYNQAKIDTALDLDGEDEFVVYIATVGRYD
jgi:SagB-type dehydrogenase family enzyme